MKYQTNKDLVESQFYLKMLDDFCKSGQVKIPDLASTVMPWDLKEDPLKDYLIHLFTLKVTIADTGEEVRNSSARWLTAESRARFSMRL